ncbi:hypothetical protein IKS57_02720 [bacterium]|nr:hypothetical protein [bacterium]
MHYTHIVIGLLGYKVFKSQDNETINPEQNISSNIAISTSINKESISAKTEEKTITSQQTQFQVNEHQEKDDNIFTFQRKSLDARAK